MLDRFGNPHFGQEPDQFLWPHSVAVDSRGDVYIAEVSFVEWGRHQNPPVDTPASFKEVATEDLNSTEVQDNMSDPSPKYANWKV